MGHMLRHGGLQRNILEDEVEINGEKQEPDYSIFFIINNYGEKDVGILENSRKERFILRSRKCE